MSKFSNQYTIKIMAGVALLALLVILALTVNTQSDFASSEKDYNRYLPILPESYSDVVSINLLNNSPFFYSIVEKYGIRELVIFKKRPNPLHIRTDFEIELFLSGSSQQSPIKLDLINDAGLFKQNNIMYGVYKKALPFINIDKIHIKSKALTKNHLKWEEVINTPFENQIEVDFDDNPKAGDKSHPNVYESIFKAELDKIGVKYIPSAYKLINDSLYRLTDNLKLYIGDNALSIGSVENLKKFFKAINNQEPIKGHIKFQGVNADKAMAKIYAYISNQSQLNEVFDLDKMAKYFALVDLYSKRCNEGMHLVYNEDTERIEPFFVNSTCLGKMTDYLNAPRISDLYFTEQYIQELQALSEKDIYDELVITNPMFEKELGLINSYYPNEIFDYDALKINQRVIKEHLENKVVLKTQLISIDKSNIVLSIENLGDYPVQISGLKHKKKRITSLNPFPQILSKKKDTITINLPRSFENLFVSKKTKTTGFILHKHIYDLNIAYTISGLNQEKTSAIIPYQKKENIAKNLFRDETLVNNHKSIFVNNKKKEITFKDKAITIDAPLIIPTGYTFVVKPGSVIDIVAGGKIISHAPLSFKGTKKKPIVFSSSDKKGQGILVLSEGEPSLLNNVTFDGLTNPVHNGWNVTGAVSFYESPVTLNSVTIRNNTCEDALNIIRTTFTMRKCNISYTQSDAFDGDFVQGTISNCVFDNLGNDAIDVSGSDLIINNVIISNAGDKGLSAGENSKMTLNKVEISNSEIAVAGKDLSIVNAKNLKITNTKLGFTAFRKKPEFGPSNITVRGIILDRVETNYLIESTSSLFVDGKKIETSQNVKDRMYGVEFGVSSAETKNSQ